MSTTIQAPAGRSRDQGTPTPSAAVGDLAGYVQDFRFQEARRMVRPSTVIATDAPTTLEEKLHDARAALKIATAQVAMHLSRDQRSRLFHELDALLDPAEWSAEQALADQRSFGTYLRMLILHRPQREPSLGLSADGHLLAGWVEARDRLTLEFLAADEIRWTVTYYAADDDREIAAGVCSLRRLPTVLTAYDPERWLGHGAKAGDQDS